MIGKYKTDWFELIIAVLMFIKLICIKHYSNFETAVLMGLALIASDIAAIKNTTDV